jgi:hypothetical protein
MKLKILAFLGIIILMFGFVLSGISSAKIDVSINVNVPSKITVGEDFTVEIKLTNENNDDLDANDDIDIKIYMDGVLIHEEDDYNLGFDLTPDNSTWINISSKSFRVDGDDIWSKNLMDYECGEDKEIEVEVSGDVSDADYADEMNIEPTNEDYELSFTISPQFPLIDDKITITVFDEDDDELKNANVKITRLGDNDEWDYDDAYWRDETDSNGEVEIKLSEYHKFKNDPYSKYQVDVYVEGKYCKVTKYFDTRRKLNISEMPPTGFVGKSIKVRVVDDVGNPVQGASVTLSRVGFHKSFKTDAGGYASFTLNETGTYDVMASKTNYVDSEIKTLEVKVRGSIGISIKPKAALVGKEVKIVVTGSDGALLEGAKVLITKPDGTQESVKTTPSTGQISYTPPSPGTYKVKVEEASHTPGEDSFTATNEFKITLPDKVELNKDVTLIVKNQNGILVEGATVTVSGTTIAGTTNKDGKFTFKLEKPGDFTVTVKKSEFKDGSARISIKGKLSVEVDPEETEVDKEVKIKVLDAQGNEIKDASIEINRPDGSKETISAYEYTPNLPGNYTITASKANYEPATSKFKVKKLPLDLAVEIEDTTLKAIVTSRGEPLVGIPVIIETIFGGEELVTDELGMVEVTFVNITEPMNITIKVDQPKYEKKSVIEEVKPSGGIFSVWLLLIILVLLLIVAVYARLKRGKIGKGRETVKREGISLLGKKRKERSGGGLSKL